MLSHSANWNKKLPLRIRIRRLFPDLIRRQLHAYKSLTDPEDPNECTTNKEEMHQRFARGSSQDALNGTL